MKQFYIILSFILSLPLFASAQLHYPIRTTTIVTPPVPYTLDGFVSQPGRLMLHIMVDDITLSQYPVKLRLHIEGNGIRITTNPNTPQQPVYLDGGVVTQLTGPDLELFFNPSNLLFQGYSQSEYNRNGRLPEGVYRIRFEVLDYYRNFQVSSAIPAVAMLSLTGAPVLTFPANRSEVDIDMTPVLRFSWMAVFTAIPDALISYRFRLWQVRPDSRDPYEIVRVTSPLYETTTHETALLYDGSMPPLTRGSRYVWQVTAIDEGGKVLFKNNGDSDIFTLRYGKQCSAPSAVITKVTHNSVAVSWNSDPSVREYAVRYKKEDATGWQEVSTRQAGITIEGLDHSALYELTVTGNCGTETSENERVLRFKTDRFVDYSCGASAPGISLENREPLPALHRFDEFMAADFYVEVTEVSGSNGVFTGRGIASVPYLNFLQFEVVFNGITINSDRRMIDGKVVFVYDEATGMIIGGDMGRGDDADDTAPQSYNHQEALDYIAGHTVTLDEDVQTVTLDNKGQVTVVTESGQKKSFLVGENRTLAIITPQSTTIVDQASGQTFHLPNTSPGSSSDVRSRAQSKLYGCEVSFRPSPGQRFGFDAVGNGVVKPNSYFLRDRNGDAIPWKSLEVGNTDRVAMLSNGDCQTDSLRFIRESGILTPTTPGNNTLELLLTGGFEGQEERLTVARATTQQLNDSTTEEILTEAGVLGLVSYQRITRDVFLVPVNNSQFPSKGTDRSVIAKRFNEIYGPGLVNWNVHVDEAIEVGTLNEADFKVEGTATLSKYTSDMNKVIRRYKRDRVTDDNTMYLFFMEIPSLGSNRKGFMPLAGNYGFIFNFEARDLELMAHELAHGAFNLRHTFSDKAQHYFPQNQTANLMDYAGGTELWKYQWDLIHNPEKILFSWSQSEEEGAMMDLNMSKESIKGVVDLIRESNVVNKKTADLSLFSLSKGSCINLELTDDFTLEYIEVKIGSGKNLGDQDNPFLCEPLTISPMGLNSVNIATPASQNGDFVQIYFNRFEQAAPPRSGIVESDNVGVSFVIKEAQKDEFEEYIHSIKPVFLSSISWVSQLDEDVFGLCTGCWRTSCCRRAAEYMMGNTNIANCTDSLIAISPAYLPVLRRINLATFSDNFSSYTVTAYNTAIINFENERFVEAIRYIKDNLRNGLPVLIGTHYINLNSTRVPNNLNRATRHFMVVVGMGMEGDNLYFRFYDPGRGLSNESAATSISNKLIINRHNSSIQGQYQGRTYTLTEIVVVN